MSFAPITFHGMQSLESDELISIHSATIAENCVLDDDTIKPRNGYRKVKAGADLTGTTQLLVRFRPSSTSARTVVGQGGAIETLTDPSSETASDSSAATAGTPFGSTAHLSAAQLGRNLYLATDESGVAWNRMDSTFALVGLGSLAQPAIPTATPTPLGAVNTFGSLAAPTLSNCTKATAFTDCVRITPTSLGATAEYVVGTALDWSTYGWLAVFMAPPTRSSSSGAKAQIALKASGGSYEVIGEISDTNGPHFDDTPTCVFLNLNQLTAATRAAVNKLQITFDSTNLKDYVLYGYLPIPTAPTGGPQTYNVTFYNSTTHQESPLSPDVVVSWASVSPSYPSYHSVTGHYGDFRDEGFRSTNSDTMLPARNYNKSAGLDFPAGVDYASIPTISGSIPTTDQFPAADTARLWRVTETGRRLVKQYTFSSGTTYSFVDDQGDLTLTHDLYKPQGTPPRANALTSRAQRLIAAYENRIYISSFVPTSASNDPYPQFPDIPQETSDGWSFDIAPSNVEQVQWLGNGDALYILSNEAAYVMTNLDPNSPPYKVFERGALGRRAAVWAEERLFYAGWDGVYTLANRVSAEELSQPIRRMYREWFAPDATTVVSYQGRKLYLFCGTKFLRYDFVKQRWTRGTVADTMLHTDEWRDPSGTIQPMWLLASNGLVYRWQPADVVGVSSAATSDDGAVIPAWIYQTGYDFSPDKGRIRKIYLQTSGPAVQLSIHTSPEDSEGRALEHRPVSHEAVVPADLTSYQFRLKMIGLGGADVRRLLWERVPVAGEGAGTQ